MTRAARELPALPELIGVLGAALRPDGGGSLRSQLPVAPGATLSLIPKQPSGPLVVVLRDGSGRALTLQVEPQEAL